MKRVYNLKKYLSMYKSAETWHSSLWPVSMDTSTFHLCTPANFNVWLTKLKYLGVESIWCQFFAVVVENVFFLFFLFKQMKNRVGGSELPPNWNLLIFWFFFLTAEKTVEKNVYIQINIYKIFMKWKFMNRNFKSERCLCFRIHFLCPTLQLRSCTVHIQASSKNLSKLKLKLLSTWFLLSSK